jgi:hypothetical protein
MAELYNRVCELTIGNRVFNYPPFSIDFEQTLKLNVPSQTVVKLYNPAPETVEACEPTGSGRNKQNANITVSAGYKDDNGTCVIGEIYDFSFKSDSIDKVLECKVSDKTSKWQNAIINETYRNMRASDIITAIINAAGLSTTSVTVQADKTYKTFTATRFRTSLLQLVRDTDSEFYFKNGTIKIQPKTERNQQRVYRLTPNTGLIETPQKTNRGYKIKTLFFFAINLGDYVHIESRNIDNTFKIINGKKIFSTFEKAFCEFEVVQ